MLTPVSSSSLAGCAPRGAPASFRVEVPRLRWPLLHRVDHSHRGHVATGSETSIMRQRNRPTPFSRGTIGPLRRASVLPVNPVRSPAPWPLVAVGRKARAMPSAGPRQSLHPMGRPGEHPRRRAASPGGHNQPELGSMAPAGAGAAAHLDCTIGCSIRRDRTPSRPLHPSRPGAVNGQQGADPKALSGLAAWGGCPGPARTPRV
jgi:hypothetical protein